MKSFTIKENDRGQRLDKFIKKVTINFPDSLLNKYLRLKRIKVNGRRAENRQMLELNDLVELYINDEFFPFDKDEELKFLNAPNKIQIVYEDENILLCDKP
ncbi:MAG: RluA family pseudouridine synthase, partial [Oscillospiraceae bacterium]